MKMPIVSFAPMSMNESVCATCCYELIASPSNYYWQVLNGGFINYRPENYPVWRDTIDAGWMEIPFDVDFPEEWAAVPFLDEKNRWWVQYTIPDQQPARVSLEDFIGEAGALAKKTNENCTHTGEQCLYFAIGVPPPYREHIESTNPHVTAAGVFRAPHPALQFDS